MYRIKISEARGSIQLFGKKPHPKTGVHADSLGSSMIKDNKNIGNALEESFNPY